MRQIMLVLAMMTTPICGAIFYPIDTTVTLQCRFSAQQHNRILIENSRIKKIIFPEDKLHVRMEETSGQVFIQQKSFVQDKIVVSIVAQSGVVQDVEIEFGQQPSQVVVLQEMSLANCPCLQEACCLPAISSSAPAAIIEAVLHGKIPYGFISAPITNSSRLIKPGVKAKLLGRLQGGYEDLYIYQIQNTRIWKKRLLERDFASKCGLWVYLQKRCLKPNETSLMIMAVQP